MREEFLRSLAAKIGAMKDWDEASGAEDHPDKRREGIFSCL
jgi:hypothetical protein